MAELAKTKATYEDLYSIPEHTTGEIIDGELVVTPRPSRKHVYTATALGGEITSPYQFGRGGPGGWIILVEPEIKLADAIVVPDLAGWKRERFPVSEESNWISVVPDWVCEILSPTTFRTDKVKKMPLYARHAVAHIWLIDPAAMTLDAFRLEPVPEPAHESGRWLLLGSYAEKDRVRVEPFEALEIKLEDLWLESVLPPTI